MIKRLLLLSGMALVLSACGWHLRGTTNTDLDLNSVFISAENTHGDLATELKRYLKSSNVEATDSSTGADYHLYLSNERQERRTASVSTDALVSEYELSSSVDFRVVNKSGEEVIPLTIAQAIRSYEFDRNAVVAKAEEEKLVQREMRNNLIQQILRRLRFINSPSKTDPSANGKTAS